MPTVLSLKIRNITLRATLAAEQQRRVEAERTVERMSQRAVVAEQAAERAGKERDEANDVIARYRVTSIATERERDALAAEVATALRERDEARALAALASDARVAAEAALATCRAALESIVNHASIGAQPGTVISIARKALAPADGANGIPGMPRGEGYRGAMPSAPASSGAGEAKAPPPCTVVDCISTHGADGSGACYSPVAPPPPTPFRAGDRVRCVDASGHLIELTDLRAGQTYRVARVSDGHVWLEDDGIGWRVSRFVAAPETPASAAAVEWEEVKHRGRKRSWRAGTGGTYLEALQVHPGDSPPWFWSVKFHGTAPTLAAAKSAAESALRAAKEET